MKDEDINLVAEKENDKKMERIIATSSLVMFGIVFAIAAALIIYSLLLRARLAAIESDIGKLRAQTSAVAVKKEKILAISERIGSIKKILPNRSQLSTTISSILSLVSDTFSIDGVDADSLHVSVSLSSDSLADFATFLSKTLPEIARNSKFGVKSIDISSFAQNKNGYSLAFVINFKNRAE